MSGRAVLRDEIEGIEARIEGFQVVSVKGPPRSVRLWRRVLDMEVAIEAEAYSPADGDPTVYVATRIADRLGLEVVEAVADRLPEGAVP